MKLFSHIAIFFLLLVFFLPLVLFAQGAPVSVEPLTGLPGFEEAVEGGTEPLLNQLYRYLIGIAAILAVLVLMYGGFKYMTSEAVDKKSQGRDDMWRAILGLILVLSPFLVFSVINPSILNLDLPFSRLDAGQREAEPSRQCEVFPQGLTLIGNYTRIIGTPVRPVRLQGDAQDRAYCCEAQQGCSVTSETSSRPVVEVTEFETSFNCVCGKRLRAEAFVTFENSQNEVRRNIRSRGHIVTEVCERVIDPEQESGATELLQLYQGGSIVVSGLNLFRGDVTRIRINPGGNNRCID